MSEKLFTCPCCGYKTLKEEPPGTFDICPVCFWEDDNIQLSDPDYEGGANGVSLRKAQRNFIEKGACEERLYAFVEKPEGKYTRDPNWKPLSQSTQSELVKKIKPDFIADTSGTIRRVDRA